ncbi:MAG: tryptophan--tRNA ligase [Elusimicrobiales bacterium]
MKKKLVSGMRTTGRLHLGNYFGALKNWAQLQDGYDCYFFTADWHVLTTKHDNTENIVSDTREMVIDWLCAGLDPQKAVIFRQSDVPEHAELALLLGMITPVGWLLRCPTYKEQLIEIFQKKYAGQMEHHKTEDASKLMSALNQSAGIGGDAELAAASELASFGFLGYPVLQAADISVHGGEVVPVGQDQVAHIEISREIARKFNDLYGAVLPEPQPLLSQVPKVPGTDGRKMSKSYGNAIEMCEAADSAQKKVMAMFTDPGKKRANDKGNPDGCVVFAFHKICNPDFKTREGECREGAIGCVNCKKHLFTFMEQQLAGFREKRKPYESDPQLADKILAEGGKKARASASETMKLVRKAMKLA